MDFARQAVLEVWPNARVVATPISGYTGCLEVIVNGTKLHSKLGGEGTVGASNKAQFQNKLRMMQIK